MSSVVLVGDMRAGGEGGAFTRRGWCEPQSEGAWTVGTESSFVIDLPARCRSPILAITANPHLYPGLSSARLEILANGTLIGTFRVSGPSEIVCPVPGSAIPASGVLDITLHHPDAARIADFREYAFLVSRIELRGSTAPPQGVETALDARMKRLLARFESIGDNCELGLVQRRCGFEPLSLFRFANVPLWAMSAALQRGLEGLDDPAALSLLWVPAIRGEGLYPYVHHIGYGITWHAAMHDAAEPPERVLARESRKIAFLRRSFLETLRHPEDTILVLRRREPLRDEDVAPLWEAVRRFGPNRLLWLVPGEANGTAGTVMKLEPGLAKGHIEHLAPDDDLMDISVRGWLEVCARAAQVLDEA